MATVVCQGLQSCFESHLVEPRTLRLKLSCFLDSTTVDENEGKCFCDGNKIRRNDPNPEMGGWSFLQTLSIAPQISSTGKTEKENVYVHPMEKPSFKALSERSLELCTENLGNETGCDIKESSIFSLSCSSLSTDSPVREQTKHHRQHSGTKKVIARDFPPPLSSLSGSENLRVRSHREEGRLVIEATNVASQRPLLRVERADGRLRLSLMRDCSTPSFDSDEAGNQENEGLNIENEREEEFENDGNFEEDEEELDVNENSLEVGVEMGMEQFQRASRCKEGEKGQKEVGLLNWEPFWVAA